jgi:DNA end-binding protein Ku
MASRSVWKGFIRFSLVSVPVKAYAGAASGGGVSLNQLHRECNSRVQYKKVCPTHGELKADDIVSGYQFDKDRYVVIEPDELDKLWRESDKAVNIESFVPCDAIEPRYYSGRTNFLVPDGPIALKPYGLLHRVMTQANRHGFAKVVLSGKEQLVLLRPVENLLAMSFLSYASEVKSLDEFRGEAPTIEVDPAELKLAKTLVDQLTVSEFDLSEYKDSYTENLTKLVQAKVKGEEIVSPPDEVAPQVANLMEALQKSVASASAKAKGGKPPKRMAPSVAATADGKARKRKTS